MLNIFNHIIISVDIRAHWKHDGHVNTAFRNYVGIYGLVLPHVCHDLLSHACFFNQILTRVPVLQFTFFLVTIARCKQERFW